MRSAALVDQHLDVWVLPDDGPGCAGVVQMDVGQEDVTDVGPPDTIRLQSQLECGKTRCGAGVDDRHPAMALHQPACDDLRPSAKVQIDPRESMTQCVHSVGLY